MSITYLHAPEAYRGRDAVGGGLDEVVAQAKAQSRIVALHVKYMNRYESTAITKTITPLYTMARTI